MRRIFASCFRTGFVSSFRWIPSETNYSDKGSRFFDRDYDPSKSLLRVHAQRLTRISLTRTYGQDCLSPSPMHLDGGQVDLRSHIHVPSVSVKSDDLWSSTEDVAAVSSQCSSVIGRNDCIGGFRKEMCPVTLGPLTWCGLPPGLVGSQLLNTLQIQWSSAASGTEACHARSPTKVDENCPKLLDFWPFFQTSDVRRE